MPYENKNRSIGGGNRLEKKRDDAWRDVLSQSAIDSDNSEEIFSMNPSKKLDKKMKKYERLDKRYKKKKGPFAGSTSKGSARNNY